MLLTKARSYLLQARPLCKTFIINMLKANPSTLSLPVPNQKETLFDSIASNIEIPIYKLNL